MSRLEGKVALVTGGNQGIGKGIARALAKEGANLVLTARTVETLESAAEEIRAEGVEALVAPADVTDESQVEAVFAQTMDRFGRVDVLVNNAAAFDGGRIDELSASAWDWAMAVNLRGPFLCTRAAFRIMKEQGGGRIINIGSISAQRVRAEFRALQHEQIRHHGPYACHGAGRPGTTVLSAPACTPAIPWWNGARNPSRPRTRNR